MIGLGNLVLAALLGAAGCHGQIDGSAWFDGLADTRQDPFLGIPPATLPQDRAASPSKDLGEKTFTLRHIQHRGAHKFPSLHRIVDVSADTPMWLEQEDGRTRRYIPEKLTLRVKSGRIQRMVDRSSSTIQSLLDHVGTHGEAKTLSPDAWTTDEIAMPNVTDKATVLSFAHMAANAYVEEPGTGDWKDVKGGFNYSDKFGWEKDGLRGYVFADETNNTVVIALKGTTPALFDGAETTENDKINDNLFGSCCCGQGGQYLWKVACQCMTDAFTCNQTCLVESLRNKDHYYSAGRSLFESVRDQYPNAENIWLAGHSLGGVVSALVGLTYGVPVLTFEAYPDGLAASRLKLPTPPGYRQGSHHSRLDTAIFHFGHSADPIFEGQCNSYSSSCTLYGYAFQSQCHTGQKCRYDTVKDYGWRLHILNHRILTVISSVLEAYDEPAACREFANCPDCFLWKFEKSNGSEVTTTSSSTSSRIRTRTETCKTPGWWGCLDESTTTTTTTTSSSSNMVTTTTTTTTCKTPGWFGCKDPTTTSSSSSATATPVPTITTSLPISTSTVTTTTTATTTCETPGWFGCKDSSTTTSTATTTTTTASPTPSPSTTLPSLTASTTHSSSKCTSRAWFGLICADPSSPSTSHVPTSTSSPRHGKTVCVRRRWYGVCMEWQSEFDAAAPEWELRKQGI